MLPQPWLIIRSPGCQWARRYASASSKVGVTIVVLVFAIVLALAVRAALRHFKGEGGCCGKAEGEAPHDGSSFSVKLRHFTPAWRNISFTVSRNAV